MKLASYLLILAFVFAPIVGRADTMAAKLEYQKKAESDYTRLKKDVDDAKERIGFALRKNRKQMKYVVNKMKKELESVNKDVEGLRSSGEAEWASFKPKLEEAFKDLHKEWEEVHTLMSEKEKK